MSFRAFVYANMYIAPDAPYGVSDVIELVLGVVLLAFGAVAEAEGSMHPFDALHGFGTGGLGHFGEIERRRRRRCGP